MSWTYRPELDGLRTVAVYLVLLFHTKMVWMEGGFIGVDVFFVLSGFLVTNVIMSELDGSGRFSLGTFYARRIRRLLPASLLVVVVTSLLWLLVASQPQRLEIVRDAQSALVYLSNWHFISEANDYFATDTDSSPFLHFWSLSIEEQFYAFYPLVLLGLLKVTRRREVRVLAALAALAAVSIVLQVVVAAQDETRAYFGTETRLYQLLVGAALAFALRELARRRPDGTTGLLPAPLLAAAPTLGLVVLLVLGSGTVPVNSSVRGLLAAAASVVTIAGLMLTPRSLAGRLLSRPVPVYLGRISYGTYLWHWPVILLFGMFLDIRPAIMAVLAGIVATALAALSFQLVETPLRTAALLKPFRWTTVVVGLAGGVLIAAFVVPPVLEAGVKPATAAPQQGAALAAADAAGLDRPVPTGLDFESIALKRGVNDRWCQADTIERCLATEGDDRTVVLVGDSHARMIEPALRKLAKEKGFTFYINVVAACPWWKDVYNGFTDPSNAEQCRSARERFWDETLPAMKPDVVLLSALHRNNEGWENGLEDPEGRTYPRHVLPSKAVPATMRSIAEAGARAVIVKSIWGTAGYAKGPDPLDCLARATTLADCAVAAPQGQPFVDSLYDVAAVESDNVFTLDLNRIACPAMPVCSPVVDHRVVWRNADHLNAAYVSYVRDKIWRELEPVFGD